MDPKYQACPSDCKDTKEYTLYTGDFSNTTFSRA
jgi:hypothetical protein